MINYVVLTMSSNLRVHIVPVGFESLRVTEPLIHMHADKVYLVRYKQDDIVAKFYRKIRKELTEKCGHVCVEDIFVDIWDLYACIEEFRAIMQKEKKNHVYVNVSTGTKITAIAGMLSCMMWNAEPYYAPVSYIEKRKITEAAVKVEMQNYLPTYEIKQPKHEFMQILELLHKHDGPMKKSLMIEKLEKMGIIKEAVKSEKGLSKPAKHSKLRSMLDPMQIDWNLISVKSSGRKSEVSIEPQGIQALRIFGVGSKQS